MFKIVTDSTADLPAEYLQEHDLGCINLSYIMDGVTYGQGQELPEKEFYALMRNGKMPTTSQVNPEEAKNHFLKYLKENKEILCIAFSSGLSGTYNSMRVAAEEIMEEQPDCRIIVIDSLCASLGEGLLVHKAVTLRDQGKSLEEVAEWVKNNRLHLVHVFTVDDLYHLYRGGRVSRATAVVGTLAGIKPKLHVDDEGHLIVIGKVRGRKKSLHALVDYMEEKMGSYRDQNDIVFISHGDDLPAAELVRDLVKERFGIDSFLINYVGPTIGSHSGPGTLAGIKPKLHVDNDGHLIVIGKVRGRKKSLHALVDYMEEKMGSYRDQNDIVFISHGDDLPAAELVRDLVKARFGMDSFLINYVGPTIGSHSGPGTLALFFMGEER